jgi:hypothetical protein
VRLHVHILAYMLSFVYAVFYRIMPNPKLARGNGIHLRNGHGKDKSKEALALELHNVFSMVGFRAPSESNLAPAQVITIDQMPPGHAL